jgi:opacity protein-like surface antigen
MKVRLLTVMIAAVFIAASGSAQSDDGWKFEVTPYIWFMGLDGDVTVGGHKADFDKSFSDIFDATELGGSVRIGAEKNRIVIGALVDYLSVSTDELDQEDQPQRGSLDSEMLLSEVAIGYRVDGWAEGQSFVFMAGVRNLHVESDLTVNGVGDFSRENDITDGMLYILPSVPMFSSKIDGLRFNPVIGIGAGDSDLVYELFPQVQYQIRDNMAARLGYRTVGWKFDGDNDNELNVDISGFTVGLGWTY